MEKNSFNNKLNLVDNFTKNNDTIPHNNEAEEILLGALISDCLLYTSPSPRD